jgi:hypothetical protein
MKLLAADKLPLKNSDTKSRFRDELRPTGSQLLQVYLVTPQKMECS